MKFLIIIFMLVSSNLVAQTSNQIDHIEIYGETGKGDTAYIFLKSGKIEKQFLKTNTEKEKFNKQYAAYLQHPQTKEKMPATKSYIIPADSLHKNISEFTFSNDSIWITLKNGSKEKYSRHSKTEMQKFESKYGKFSDSTHE